MSDISVKAGRRVQQRSSRSRATEHSAERVSGRMSSRALSGDAGRREMAVVPSRRGLAPPTGDPSTWRWQNSETRRKVPQRFIIKDVNVKIEEAARGNIRIRILDKSCNLAQGKQVLFCGEGGYSGSAAVRVVGLPKSNFLLVQFLKSGEIKLKSDYEIKSGRTLVDESSSSSAMLSREVDSRVVAHAAALFASERTLDDDMGMGGSDERSDERRLAVDDASLQERPMSAQSMRIKQINRHLLVAESELSRLISESKALGMEAKILEERLKEVLAHREVLNSGIEQKREEVDLLKVEQQEILRSPRSEAHLGDDSTRRDLHVGDREDASYSDTGIA